MIPSAPAARLSLGRDQNRAIAKATEDNLPREVVGGFNDLFMHPGLDVPAVHDVLAAPAVLDLLAGHLDKQFAGVDLLAHGGEDLGDSPRPFRVEGRLHLHRFD